VRLKADTTYDRTSALATRIRRSTLSAPSAVSALNVVFRLLMDDGEGVRHPQQLRPRERRRRQAGDSRRDRDVDPRRHELDHRQVLAEDLLDLVEQPLALALV